MQSAASTARRAVEGDAVGGAPEIKRVAADGPREDCFRAIGPLLKLAKANKASIVAEGELGGDSASGCRSQGGIKGAAPAAVVKPLLDTRGVSSRTRQGRCGHDGPGACCAVLGARGAPGIKGERRQSRAVSAVSWTAGSTGCLAWGLNPKRG